jgi:AraC family transcriptional regulator
MLLMGMRNGTIESYQERIQRVLVHIENHLDAPLPLEDLAGVACFSPYHFHRVFRGMTGVSVKEHVRRLRLERAARRLKFSQDAVISIALDSGYQAPESFARAFQAVFGEAPAAYRQSAREFAPPPAAGALPPIDARIVRIGPLRLAFVRHVGAYDEVGVAWGRLMAWAGRRGLLGPSIEAPLGVLHDDVDITPPESLRYDAALIVSANVAPEGEVGVQELPASEYAMAIHKGPYSEVSDTYARLAGQWLPASGRELATAPGIEIYRNAPFEVPPEELITEVHLPLAPKE